MKEAELKVAITRVPSRISAHSSASDGNFYIFLRDVAAHCGGSSHVSILLDNTALNNAGDTGPVVWLKVSGQDEILTMADGFEALAQALREIA